MDSASPRLPEPARVVRSRGVAIAIALVLFLAGIATRGWHVDTRWDHPDEPIATGIHRQLDKTWDTNWRGAGLPPAFDYDQYNFSSYLITAHAWAKATAWAHPASWREERGQLLVLRTFSVLCGALAVVWTWWLGQRFWNRAAGLVGAFFVLAHPQLVADGHYGRPEAFLTWLMLVAAGIASGTTRPLLRTAAVAALVGFMTAAKITMLPLLIFALVPAWGAWRAERKLSTFMRLATILAMGAVAGFALGAPAALANPGAYWNGIYYLMRQYSGGHPPHDLPDGSRIGGVMADYFLTVTGWAVPFLAAVGIVAAWRTRRLMPLWLLALPAVLAFAHFATQRTFFERNLSHILPGALLLAGFGAVAVTARWDGWRAAVGAAVIGLLASWPAAVLSYHLVHNSFSGRDMAKAMVWDKKMDDEIERLGVESRYIGFTLPDDLERLRRDFTEIRTPLVIFFSEFDDWGSRTRRAEFEREFVFHVVGVHEPALSRVPISGLRVYHGARSVCIGIVGRQPGVTKP